jgi:YetA-like protein
MYRLTWLWPATVAAAVALGAETVGNLNVYVKESAGIRRTAYPVDVRVPFPKGTLTDPGRVRLLNGGMEIPAQIAVDGKWADGSIQWLSLDFNVSIGPLESQTLTLEYGEKVKPGVDLRGLTVTENTDNIEVGRVRFNKSGTPLVASVNYRSEEIGRGTNGLVVTDSSGKDYDLTNAAGLRVQVVKGGPLYVSIRYSGTISVDGGFSAPFVVTAEMPNSKSWVKLAATVEDPERRVTEISFHTPLALGPLPWVWDFGTNHWTYGTLRNPGDGVALIAVMKSVGAEEWTVRTRLNGVEQTYETGAVSRSQMIRWGHFQDGKEVVAFAVENTLAEPGTYRIALAGDGQTAFRFAPAMRAVRHQLTVYEHYVPVPVQTTAATSPSSILNPLTAVCDKKQYAAAGVPAPR